MSNYLDPNNADAIKVFIYSNDDEFGIHGENTKTRKYTEECYTCSYNELGSTVKSFRHSILSNKNVPVLYDSQALTVIEGKNDEVKLSRKRAGFLLDQYLKPEFVDTIELYAKEAYSDMLAIRGVNKQEPYTHLTKEGCAGFELLAGLSEIDVVIEKFRTTFLNGRNVTVEYHPSAIAKLNQMNERVEKTMPKKSKPQVLAWADVNTIEIDIASDNESFDFKIRGCNPHLPGAYAAVTVYADSPDLTDKIQELIKIYLDEHKNYTRLYTKEALELLDENLSRKLGLPISYVDTIEIAKADDGVWDFHIRGISSKDPRATEDMLEADLCDLDSSIEDFKAEYLLSNKAYSIKYTEEAKALIDASKEEDEDEDENEEYLDIEDADTVEVDLCDEIDDDELCFHLYGINTRHRHLKGKETEEDEHVHYENLDAAIKEFATGYFSVKKYKVVYTGNAAACIEKLNKAATTVPLGIKKDLDPSQVDEIQVALDPSNEDIFIISGTIGGGLEHTTESWTSVYDNVILFTDKFKEVVLKNKDVRIRYTLSALTRWDELTKKKTAKTPETVLSSPPTSLPSKMATASLSNVQFGAKLKLVGAANATAVNITLASLPSKPEWMNKDEFKAGMLWLGPLLLQLVNLGIEDNKKIPDMIKSVLIEAADFGQIDAAMQTAELSAVPVAHVLGKIVSSYLKAVGGEAIEKLLTQDIIDEITAPLVQHQVKEKV